MSVLILVFSVYGGLAVEHIQFQTPQACEAAKALVLKGVDALEKDYRRKVLTADCTPA